MARHTAIPVPQGLLRWAGWAIVIFIIIALKSAAHAHGVGEDDRAFIEGASGMAIGPYMYLGAKHMVTGYDHLLFLVGVIFFLFRLRQIALYVSLFSLGHSITLLAGVFFGLHIDSRLVDAVIGLSVAYKAFDNLAGFQSLFGVQPNAKAAVFGFGLIHGFGLATKLQALKLNREGLLTNLVSFNVGVELGQIIALSLILVAMTVWRRTRTFEPMAAGANVLLMLAGFVLCGQQIGDFIFGGPAS